MVRIVRTTPEDTNISGQYVDEDEVLVILDAADAPYTIEVPDAQIARNTVFHFKKVDSSLNVVTIKTDTAQTIDGLPDFTLAGQFTFKSIVSDGENYLIIGEI